MKHWGRAVLEADKRGVCWDTCKGLTMAVRVAKTTFVSARAQLAELLSCLRPVMFWPLGDRALLWPTVTNLRSNLMTTWIVYLLTWISD